MGTISSVYVVPAAKNNLQPNSQNETENTSQEVRSFQEKVMETNEENGECLTSATDDRHLAQENFKLTQINKELTDAVERLKRKLDESNTVSANVGEIFGETSTQKIIRLEKLLENERREKWEMIEKSETSRVELVNTEKELTEKNKKVEQLETELENSKRQAIGLVSERLKTDESTEENDEGVEKSSRLQSELERFRADLVEKRQARRKALSAVSAELNRLRDELENEKEVRRKLERDLLLAKKTDVIQDEDSTSDLSIICAKKENETLKREVVILTEDVEKLKELRTENSKLKLENRQLTHEISSLKTVILQLKNDYKEERRKFEKTNREKAEMEKEMDRNDKMRKDLENEKDKMWEEYDKEKEEINKRTCALKQVIEISKQMLAIRESQVQELKTKLKEIEESVAHSRVLEEEGLKVEYEKQLENIKTLKELYEERVRLMEMERDKLKETITQHLKTIQEQQGEIDGLKEQYGNTSQELEKEKSGNESLERDLKMSMAKSKDFENELALMNNMFTQMLLGPFNSGNDTDLDKLTEFLQENHQLITELTTKEESSEIASAFPKLLLDLLTQGTENPDPNLKNASMFESTDTISEQSESVLEENQGAVLPVLSYKNATVFRERESIENKTSGQEQPKPSESIDPAVQEIASNLPKVWKVLTELLSIHSSAEGPTPGDEKQCYKNVETPYGTKSVISVSNTFIRLKDLILEKKSLQKELARLKQLNSHLEIRLDDQEKRLSQVQCELHKTWGIVGKMRAQHQQLHNHEKILRYELQEKRIMLGELKQELEYCKDKWERARQKNAESETEWKKLRKEFAARKIKKDVNSNLYDSAESGFSDEPNESGDEQADENFDPSQSSEQGTSKGAVPKVRDGSKSLDKSKSRAIRLKRLEDQCQLLVRQVDITTHKSNFLSNRLEELHEHHASSEEIHRPIILKRDAEPAAAEETFEANQTEEAASCLQPTESSLSLACEEESQAKECDDEKTTAQVSRVVSQTSVPNTAEKSEQFDEIHEVESESESNLLKTDICDGLQEESDETKFEGEKPSAQVSFTVEISENQPESPDEVPANRLEPESPESEDERQILGATNSEKVTRENPESEEEHLLVLESEARSIMAEQAAYTIEENTNVSVQLEEGATETDEISKPNETREERLQRLEMQGRSLLTTVINTMEKSENISNKLDEMHAKCLQRRISRENSDEREEARNEETQNKTLDEGCEGAISLPESDELKEETPKTLETRSSNGNISATLSKGQEDYVTSEESTGEKTMANSAQQNTNSESSARGAIPKTETREQRLKRLEEECQSFMNKVTNTVQKSIDLSNKLEDIHDTYVNYEVSKMTLNDEKKESEEKDAEEKNKDTKKN